MRDPVQVEHVHQIPGRGTVLTGRAERGKCKVGQEMEIVGQNREAYLGKIFKI